MIERRLALALAICAVLGVAGAAVWANAPSTADRSLRASDIAPTGLRAQASAPDDAIAARPSSSAALVTNWTAPQVELEQIEAAAERGRAPLELVHEDYERNAELVHWATGNADAGPRGRALAQCYAQSINQLSRECAWEQRVVIQRIGPNTGAVVHVAQAYDEAGSERACARMIACVNAAWRHAEAPLPTGSDEFVTLEFPGSPCFLGESLSAEQRSAAVQEREAYSLDYIDSLRSCDRPACEYNSRGMQSCIDHLASLTLALEEP